MLRLTLNPVPAELDTPQPVDVLDNSQHELLEPVPADVQRKVLVGRDIPRHPGT